MFNALILLFIYQSTFLLIFSFCGFAHESADCFYACFQPLAFFGGEAELKVGVTAAADEKRSAVSDPDAFFACGLGDI